MTAADDPYSPPKASLEAEPHAAATVLELDTPRSRLQAAILDWVAYALCQYAARWLLAFFAAAVEGLPGWVDAALRVAAPLAFVFAAHAAFVTAVHGSPGKAILGMRIVRADGQEASVARLLLARPLLYASIFLAYGFLAELDLGPEAKSTVNMVVLVVFVADSLPVFGRDRRCWHDRIAGTVVVKRRPA